jgi:Peptidase family M1 domain
MQKWFLYILYLFICISSCSIPMLGKQELSDEWQNSFKAALRSGSMDQIQRFFKPGFAHSELESWKYQIQRGFLDYKSTSVIPLTKDALLIYIPTDSSCYSGENTEKYFDFIYRIYRIKPVPKSSSPDSSEGFAVTHRCMDDLNPDFLTCRETLELFPASQTMSVDSEIKSNLKSNRLIFKLAKEFQLQSLIVNGKKHSFQRFGYFVTAKVDAANPVSFRVKGNIEALSDHNQFFCIDENNFFLRSGGFAATPSPPPDNHGRPYFSSDQAKFSRVIRFPDHYKFLVYGDIINDVTGDGKRTLTSHLTESYEDGLSFYAQTDWNVKSIQRGKVKAGFYFPASAHKEQDFLKSEIDGLLNWLNHIFRKDSSSDFAINFVVLDKFVKTGLLNDGKSIIASRADIIGSRGGGYIHELCHLAPQAHIDGNVLWVKEGFTNYLAFNFLRDIKKESDFWKQQKRKLLHRFNLYCEPLGTITNKGIPCYWSVYQKGPWIYRMLETELGKENFDKTMTAFGKNEGETFADTNEYFNFIERVSGKDLSAFRSQWLERKQNPVLRVRHKLIPANKIGAGKMLTVHVSQETPVFHIPLDIEIKTEKQTIRHTLQLDAPVKEMSVPIDSRLVAVQYDPDARVFAIIKDGTPSFVNPLLLRIPIRDAYHRFKSSKDNHIVEFEIKTGSRGIELLRRKAKEELHLELTRELSPQRFDRDGKKVYTIDTTAGEIYFPDASYDIAEPVYPHQFAIILFSMVDWEKTQQESFVYLYNSGFGSSVITATREPGQENNTIVRLDGFRSPIKLYLSNGIPVKYTSGKEDDKETFTRIK